MSILKRNDSAESNYCLLNENTIIINQSNLINNITQINKNPTSNDKEKTLDLNNRALLKTCLLPDTAFNEIIKFCLI